MFALPPPAPKAKTASKVSHEALRRRSLSPAQLPFVGYGPTTTSAARRVPQPTALGQTRRPGVSQNSRVTSATRPQRTQNCRTSAIPVAIVRPDAVAVPALARVLITGECICITRDGNGAFLARIVEVLRKGALDDATRREWFPPREPRMWAHRSLLRVQWFAEVGPRAHDARFQLSTFDLGKYHRAKNLPEVLLTKHTSLVSDISSSRAS